MNLKSSAPVDVQELALASYTLSRQLSKRLEALFALDKWNNSEPADPRIFQDIVLNFLCSDAPNAKLKIASATQTVNELCVDLDVLIGLSASQNAMESGNSHSRGLSFRDIATAFEIKKSLFFSGAFPTDNNSWGDVAPKIPGLLPEILPDVLQKDWVVFEAGVSALEDQVVQKIQSEIITTPDPEFCSIQEITQRIQAARTVGQSPAHNPSPTP